MARGHIGEQVDRYDDRRPIAADMNPMAQLNHINRLRESLGMDQLGADGQVVEAQAAPAFAPEAVMGMTAVEAGVQMDLVTVAGLPQ